MRHHMFFSLLLGVLCWVTLGLTRGNHSLMVSSSTGLVTNPHAPGQCVMYGHCGPKSGGWFAPSLPCAVSQPAVSPTETLRQQLVDLCGAPFSDPDSLVCCDDHQVEALASQTSVAYNLVGACPACWNNFIRFFCQFTCSPDQATFLNVTKTVVSPVTQKRVVTNLDLYVEPEFGDGLYQSCKDVKFPADNGFVMDLLGGGARNYRDMLKFLGQERLGGSPFQIDFPPAKSTPESMQMLNATVSHCNDAEVSDRCSCVDCDAVCPVLAEVPVGEGACNLFGHWSCWTLVTVTVYVAVALSFTLALLRFITGGFSDPEQEGFQPLGSSTDALLAEESDVEEDEADGGGFEAAHSNSALDTARKRLSPLQRFRAMISLFFYQLGFHCAFHPLKTLALVALLVTACSVGWIWFDVETNPARLWVGPMSASAQNKQYFDEHFGPFYRTEQLVLTSADGPLSSSSAPLVTRETLRQLFLVEQDIRQLVSTPNNYTFKDFCFNPTGTGCVVQSVTGYWQGDLDRFEASDWKKVFRDCTANPSACLPDYGQPLKPSFVVGGYPHETYEEAQALFSTLVVTNALDPTEIAKREEWEHALLDYLSALPGNNPQLNFTGLQLSYSTEISVETELNRSAHADIPTVALSYFVMFCYASLALGRFSYHSFRSRQFWVETKFGLGLAGILTVLASVAMAVGILSFLGFKATLIIAEVIPFLVLAVGVDNIFLLVHELQRQTADQPTVSVQQRVACTVATIGPSILLAAVAETLAFWLGAFVAMPAVSVFALYAALAVWLDFVLQMTGFIALLTLDTIRTEANRADLCPWVVVRDQSGVEATQSTWWAQGESWLQWFMSHIYGPLLTHRWVRWLVLGLFSIFFCINVTKTRHVELGLDQRLALPSDSYLVSYFDNLGRYFETGPPVYFVTKHGDVSERAEQQSLCGRFTTCDTFSLANVLEQERKRPEVSHLAQPASVWLDDYFHWLNPASESCCRVRTLSDGQTELCDPDDMDPACEVCWAGHQPAWNITLRGLPEGKEFLQYLSHWLKAEATGECPLGGAAAYGDAIAKDSSTGQVVASHVRTFHTPLASQTEFISAFQAAHRIADDLSQSTGLEVFPYSPFYIFFDQYAHIVRMSITLIGVGVIAIFLVTWLLVAHFRAAVLTMVTVVMILAHEAASMATFGVSLNAISLVNLMIGLGISVEFCCHITRKYVISAGRPNDRMCTALTEAGSAVFTGITLTKLCGIVVLAFAQSKIFQVYYFRMYLVMVISGVLHGLVFLPVLLATSCDIPWGLPSPLTYGVSVVYNKVRDWVVAVFDRLGPVFSRDSLDESETRHAERLVIRS
ncbi:niemann-Pick type C- protein 1 [Dispira parvispora]|uniref:Niemann-Pick type C- protein 1 n=1 Tax=Dispira parvispora TaxID=1520584 RepID=A0A9W8AT68_9FUNG|nr:niemann-Pick type C- protein 1 [Dispira parvispora]